ncbi:MAG: hypothetical protein ACYTG0_29220, partial [Planctomycetota bacterium]
MRTLSAREGIAWRFCGACSATPPPRVRRRREVVALGIVLAAWGLIVPLPVPCASAAEVLPFQQDVEVYRSEEGDVSVFTLRLEQPFLAEEFEKSNYLRLKSTDKRAYLIYPKETKFRQKHAEFYGRLRGEGTVKLTLSYETVSENADGTRRVDVQEGEVEMPVPAKPTGSNRIFLAWAEQQNLHFAQLLRYYPEETFFQYCLLQSKARYGVDPPSIPKIRPDRTALETDLYEVFSGGLAIQESLQWQALSEGSRAGDLTVHVSSLKPPNLRSLEYEKLLEEKKSRDGIEPAVHDVARLIPADQYFLHFHSIESMDELLDLSSHWGNALIRLFTVRAHDSQFREKLDDQLCIRRGPLARLFEDGVIREMAVTGADPFVAEGTDVTMIFRLERPEPFGKAAQGWLEEVRKEHSGVVDREFNYREHKVVAHYTNDRVVSSFVVEHEEYVLYSNSHRAIRRMIDVAVGLAPALIDELDYRYVSTILPPSEAANAGYLFASEAMIRRLVGPAAKISEKRRLQCFNNLVMLNNAALFFRMEYGRSPESLSELIEPARRWIRLRRRARHVHLLAAQPVEVSHAERRAVGVERLERGGGRIRTIQAAIRRVLANRVRPAGRSRRGRSAREARDVRAAVCQRQPLPRPSSDGRPESAADRHGANRPLGGRFAGDGGGPRERCAIRRGGAGRRRSAPVGSDPHRHEMDRRPRRPALLRRGNDPPDRPHPVEPDQGADHRRGAARFAGDGRRAGDGHQHAGLRDRRCGKPGAGRSHVGAAFRTDLPEADRGDAGPGNPARRLSFARIQGPCRVRFHRTALRRDDSAARR